jgi:hypothetical protein
LKGTRWLLLKNRYNLNEQKNEKEHFNEALKLNKPLATACLPEGRFKTSMALGSAKSMQKKYWTNG